MKSIVVGYDGSEQSKRALAKAAELAGKFGASVTVVNAGVVHGGPAVHGALPVDPDELAEVQTELAEARSILQGQGITAKLVEGRGDPAEAIVETAKDSGADLVVVGTRGQNPVARLVLGSVSTRVAHEAPCDVLVVR
jgi:nucleotide-binding universal stress UspA family protein